MTPTATSTSVPVITLANAAAQEGSGGPNVAALVTVTVTKTGTSASVMAISYSTSTTLGTATAGTSCANGTDYVTASGTLNWAALESVSKTFTISVCGDTTSEAQETVIITLSKVFPDNTAVSSSTATLTIVDDD